MATLLLLSAFTCAFAQHERTHSTMVGGGWASIYDTYLSPFTYTGSNVHLLRETRRELQHPLIHIDGLTFQTLLDIDASFVKSPAKNVDETAGGVRYSLGWLYRLPFLDRFSGTERFGLTAVHVGPQVSGYAGAIYNERNGNNPAQAKVDLMVDLTAMAQLHLRLFKRNCNLRYQVAVPFFGLAFSPQYGQSYYEAFTLKHHDHNVVFAHFANMPSMRHLLTFDFPLRSDSRTTLRVGYAGQFMQSTFNNLRYHSYTHSFMIGLTQTLNRL
ncbi:MAG: DUF3316 domain-containing protein [Bacteroidaceae bacterium]|nr:DUF3316 domain-containing protein [Bacteroidaceae bacterium]MDO4995152.1 DUF3316 domain-containing protein [Bacteroidales bacterium]